MAFPSADAQAIRRCREQSDRLPNNPALFVPADAPLQCLSAHQQEIAERRIRAFVAENLEAQRTAGMQGEFSVADEVDSTISEEANIQNIARKIGASVGPRLSEAEAEQFERDRAQDDILTLCEQLDDAGLDGATVLEDIFEGRETAARQLLAGTDVAGGLGNIERTLDDIGDVFGDLFVTGAIAECRDRLPGPADGVEAPTQDVLEQLRRRFEGVTAADPDQALAQLEDAVRNAEQQGQEAFLNQLSRGLGVQFDDIDEAIDGIRERIAAARGERLRIAPIEVRRVRDEVRVRIDTSELAAAEVEAFEQWSDNVDRRVRRELDLNQLPPAPSPWITVGEILLRGEDLDEIDLTQGADRLRRVAEPQPLEPEPEREQAELPAAETEGEQLADRALELLER